jgi:hypothetical protein
MRTWRCWYGPRLAVTYTATDGAERWSSDTTFITVPKNFHDVRLSAFHILGQITVQSTAAGTILEWAPVPDAVSYAVVRGNLADIRPSGATLDLGVLAASIPAEPQPARRGTRIRSCRLPVRGSST